MDIHMDKIKLNKEDILKKYLYVVKVITNTCDWKSTFEPEEIVDIICAIIEGREIEIIKAYEGLVDDVKKYFNTEMFGLSSLAVKTEDSGLISTSIPT